MIGRFITVVLYKHKHLFFICKSIQMLLKTYVYCLHVSIYGLSVNEKDMYMYLILYDAI